MQMNSLNAGCSGLGCADCGGRCSSGMGALIIRPTRGSFFSSRQVGRVRRGFGMGDFNPSGAISGVSAGSSFGPFGAIAGGLLGAFGSKKSSAAGGAGVPMVQNQVTVSPKITTQVSPQISPNFQQQFQPQNSAAIASASQSVSPLGADVSGNPPGMLPMYPTMPVNPYDPYSRSIPGMASPYYAQVSPSPAPSSQGVTPTMAIMLVAGAAVLLSMRGGSGQPEHHKRER